MKLKDYEIMDILFTKHTEEKFHILRRYQVTISREKVISTVRKPERIDTSRQPLSIAQCTLDTSHVLRVVYREEGDQRIIITFYPGRKSQYENEKKGTRL